MTNVPSHCEAKEDAPKRKMQMKPWMGCVLNPQTGRAIKIGSNTYLRLVRKGIIEPEHPYQSIVSQPACGAPIVPSFTPNPGSLNLAPEQPKEPDRSVTINKDGEISVTTSATPEQEDIVDDVEDVEDDDDLDFEEKLPSSSTPLLEESYMSNEDILSSPSVLGSKRDEDGFEESIPSKRSKLLLGQQAYGASEAVTTEEDDEDSEYTDFEAPFNPGLESGKPLFNVGSQNTENYLGPVLRDEDGDGVDDDTEEAFSMLQSASNDVSAGLVPDSDFTSTDEEDDEDMDNEDMEEVKASNEAAEMLQLFVENPDMDADSVPTTFSFSDELKDFLRQDFGGNSGFSGGASNFNIPGTPFNVPLSNPDSFSSSGTNGLPMPETESPRFEPPPTSPPSEPESRGLPAPPQSEMGDSKSGFIDDPDFTDIKEEEPAFVQSGSKRRRVNEGEQSSEPTADEMFDEAYKHIQASKNKSGSYNGEVLFTPLPEANENETCFTEKFFDEFGAPTDLYAQTFAQRFKEILDDEYLSEEDKRKAFVSILRKVKLIVHQDKNRGCQAEAKNAWNENRMFEKEIGKVSYDLYPEGTSYRRTIRTLRKKNVAVGDKRKR